MGMLCTVADADKDDTGRYKVEISNDSGTGTCEIPVKVKGQTTVFCLLSLSPISGGLRRLTG